MKRSELTAEVAAKLIAEHGSISAAGKSIAPKCIGKNGRISLRTAQDWLLAASRGEVPKSVLEPSKEEGLNRLKELLDRSGVPVESIGKISKIKLNEWGVGAKIKQADGTHKFVREGLYSTQLVLDPTWKTGPQWPPMQPATQRAIEYIPFTATRSRNLDYVFIIPDAQIGYWWINGKLVNMHDEKAVDVCLQALQDVHPQKVVILGDLLDCSEISRYLQVPEFQKTLQPAIQYAYEFLLQVRRIVGPKCEIIFIPGNHERRIQEYIITNAKACYGLKRADTPDHWPVLSLQNLLCFDQLNIKCEAEYPGGQHWLADDLVCQHQGLTSKTDLRASIIHGHHPQIAVNGHTVHYKDGHKVYTTHCIPGLMRLGDHQDPMVLNRTLVPSGGTRLNWSQGFGVATLTKDHKHHRVEIVPIENGFSIFRDKEYVARKAK